MRERSPQNEVGKGIERITHPSQSAHRSGQPTSAKAPHARVLLTGMSDGGTFSYVCGLRDDTVFTHLAPCSASFHPMLLEIVSAERLRDLPIYLMHGTLDWMFSVDMARTARDAFTAAGAAVEFREIEDLSHTYPREENNRILDWLAS